MTLLLSIAMLMAFCASCAKIASARKPFVASDAEYILKSGNNTLDVNAFLRQRGGTVVLCAASQIELWPVTDFSRALVKDMVGSEDGGEYGGGSGQSSMTIEDSEQVRRLREYARVQVCNSDGHAVFTGIPDGDYYLYIHLSWEDLTYTFFPYTTPRYVKTGSHLVDMVSLRGGQRLEHTMTRVVNQ
ncbi:MAG: hypothetical protein LBR80_06715 [Deltaproteobacteria bacterium]|nr:hypothetical protein [Deltaproteobacteria bacterium]